jgi:uncharacterized protein with PIN domain
MGQNRIMKYAILRVQKLKSAVGIRRSMKHAFREQETPNADAQRTPENTHIGASSSAEALRGFRARLPEKVRKNAVLAVEYLMTASPEVMASKSREAQDAYFRDALAWLKARHGAENVVYAGIHRDEKTPHMYAYVVPIDPVGKLNCRHFLGGAKALSEMQDDFVLAVGKQHGLERGIKGSKAHHTTVQQYYAAISQPEKTPVIPPSAVAPKVLKKGMLRDTVEAPEDVAERLTKAMHKVYEPAVKAAKAASLDRKRADEKDATLRSLQKRYGAFFDAIDAIPSTDGKKRALEALGGVKDALQAEWEAQMQREARISQMLQEAAYNMCQADPELSWEAALARADDMASDLEHHPELQKWLQWKPMEAAQPAPMPTPEMRPVPAKKARDDGPEFTR